MEHKGVKEYKYIRLEGADNGFILRFTACMDKDPLSNKTFDEYPQKDKEMVFKEDELDEAMKIFKSLLVFNTEAKKKSPTVTITIGDSKEVARLF
jgi:hypothetical protein